MNFTLSVQPDETSGIDTMIDNSAATTNYGTLNRFGVGEQNGATAIKRGLLKFDLSSIPAQAIILSATLSLWIYENYSANTRTMNIYRVLRNWDEGSATWYLYSTGSSWGTSGCGNATSDYDGSTVIGSISMVANETIDSEKQISLNTSLVKAWVNGTNPNYGMLLKNDTETNDLHSFHSSSSLTAGYRPKLTIVYAVPSIAQAVFIV